MEINEAEAVVGLINVGLLTGHMCVDGQVRIVSDDDGGCSGCTAWVSELGEVLLNNLLIPDLVNDVLSVADETKGCHDEKKLEMNGGKSEPVKHEHKNEVEQSVVMQGE